jgi:hypothetical protein
MVAWENKPATEQTWQALQDYFTKKWLERRQYSQATAKHSRFKDVALTAQELATAEEEDETTAMMFALLQEQHKTQMEVMAAVNQKSIDAILEQMNTMLAGQRKARDKENVQPINANLDTRTGRAARKKKRCPHCRKHVFHAATECYELEANASKCWTGWKLVKDTNITAA